MRRLTLTAALALAMSISALATYSLSELDRGEITPEAIKRGVEPLSGWQWFELPDPYRADRYNARHPYRPFSFRQQTDLSNVPADADKIVLVLVNTSLQPSIQAELNRYEQDLINDGYTVVFATAEGGTQEDMRSRLQTYYTGWGDDFNGCVLVGELPIPWFEYYDSGYGWDVFGCDLYYADMDGLWTDTNYNGTYDTHTDGSGDTRPEIWIGRVTANDMSEDEVTLVKKFFDNNHQYRMEKRRLPRRVLMYIDDDWTYWWWEWDDAFAYLRYERDLEIDMQTTNADDYETRFDDEYEWLAVCVHSNYYYHAFLIDYGSNYSYYYWDELREQNPRFHFYITFACINADYSEPDYMSGWYLFGGDYAQLVLGSTKSGGFLEGNDFFEALADGENLGDAYKRWFSNKYPYDDDDTMWWYGLTLLGDPALYNDANPYSLCDCESYVDENPFPVTYVADGGDQLLDEVELWYRYSPNGSTWSPDWTYTGEHGNGYSGEMWFLLPDGEGIYEFYTIAVDNYGQREAPPDEADARAMYDLTPPESEASSPDYSTETAFSVDFSASDNACGVAHTALWYKHDTGAWTDSGLTETGDAGTFQFTPPDGEGIYCFQSIAVDNVGNVESGPSGDGDDSTIVDSTEPESNCTSPEMTSSTEMTIDYNASDGGSGVSFVSLWYKFGAEGSWLDSGLHGYSTSGSFSFTAKSGSGTYYFQTIARDNVGNLETGPTGDGDDDTLLDLLAPESACDSPDFANAEIAVDFDASDAGGSGVESVSLWYKFESSGEWTYSGLDDDSDSGTFSFSPSDGEGYYYFQTIAADNVGNTEPGPTGDGDDHTLLDTTRPSSACSSPEFSAEIGIVVDFAGSDGSGSGVSETHLYYRHESGDWTYYTLEHGASGEFDFAASQGEGTYYFQSIALDNAGNTETGPGGDGDDSTVLDQTPPDSHCTAPEYASQVPFEVPFVSTDAASGVKETSLFYKYEGQPEWIDSWLTEQGTDGSFQLDPTMLTPEYGDGTYYLITISVDNVENEENPPESPDATVILDTTPPSSTLDCVAVTTSSPLTLDYAASDELSGVVEVRLWYRHQGGNWQDSGLSDTAEAGAFVFDFTHGDGVYDFIAKARDLAGNEESPEGPDASCIFDTTPPVSAAHTDEIVNDPTIVVEYQSTDELTEVVNIHLYYRYTDLEGNADETLRDTGLDESTSPGAFEWPPDMGFGYYSFFLAATDEAGNVEGTDGSPDAVCLFDRRLALSEASAPGYVTGASIVISFTIDIGDDGYDHVGLHYRYGVTLAEVEQADWTTTSTVSYGTVGTLDFACDDGDGCYQFYTKARSAGGLWEPAPSTPDATTVADAVPPETSVSAPEISPTSQFEIEFSASEPYGLESIDIYFWYQGDWSLLTTVYEMTGTVGFDAQGVEGEYRFYSTGLDKAGNEESPPAAGHDCSCNVDLAPPESSASVDSFGASLPIHVIYSASDTATEVAEVSLWAKYEDGEWSDTGLSGSGESGALDYTPETSQEGTYYFYTLATDAAGHAEAAPESADDQTMIDWTAPETNCSSPQYASESTIALTYTASDVLSGMYSVSAWLRFEGQPWADTGLLGPADRGVIEVNVSAWGEGAFGFCTRGRDNAGNVEELPEDAQTTTLFDATPPSSSADIPSEGIFANTTPIGVPYSASDSASGIASVSLWSRFNEGDWEDAGLSHNPAGLSAQSEGSFSFAPSHGDGKYEFTTRAIDKAGNSESLPGTPDGGDLVFDQTKPTSSVSFDGEYADHLPIHLSFTAADGCSGIGGVALFASFAGGAYEDTGLSASDTSGTFDFTPDTPADGIYRFYTVATDRAGNVELAPEAADAATVLDTSAPVSEADVSSQFSNSFPIKVSYTASDTVSGLDEVSLWVSVNSLAFKDTGLASDKASGSFNYTPKSQIEGLYAFYTLASDAAGSIELPPGEPDATVTFDKTKPVSSCSIDKSITKSYPISIVYSSSDSLSGVKTVELFYRLGNESWTKAATLSGDSGTYKFTPSPRRDGFYEFYTKATDEASNVEGITGADDGIRVDTEAPRSSASSPATAKELPILVSFVARDSGSGVAETTLWYRFEEEQWTGFAPAKAGTVGEFAFDAPNGAGKYCFFTICKDVAGNVEATPEYSDSTTTYIVQTPDISASADSFDFEQVLVGEQKSDSLIVTNVGEGDLTITEISTDHEAFSTSFDGVVPITLGPDDDLTVQITFTPSQAGEVEAELSVASNDPDTPLLTVGLSGEGVVAGGEVTVSVAANSASYEFGDTLQVQLSASNTGQAATCDIYCVLTFNLGGLEERHWSASFAEGWTEGVAPMAAGFELPTGFDVSGLVWWSSELPSKLPMVSRSGAYTLRMAAVEPGTLNLVSNLSVHTFEVTGQPFIGISTDKGSYSLSGDTIAVSPDVALPDYSVMADFYVVLLAPDGQFWSPTAFGADVPWQANVVPLIPAFDTPAGFESTLDAFVVNLPSGAPFDATGQFALFAAVVQPGTLSPFSDVGAASFLLQ